MNTIDLTNEQYEILVKLSFIGEWVLNAQHVTPEFKKEQECINHLYSNCEKFNLRKYFNQIGDNWEMNEDTVIGILPVIEEFSHNDFWSILISKLSERDTIEKIYNDQEQNVEEGEFDMLLEKSMEQYSNEFQQHGITNLRIRNVRNN
jgi:antirestriction protein